MTAGKRLRRLFRLFRLYATCEHGYVFCIVSCYIYISDYFCLKTSKACIGSMNTAFSLFVKMIRGLLSAWVSEIFDVWPEFCLIYPFLAVLGVQCLFTFEHAHSIIDSDNVPILSGMLFLNVLPMNNYLERCIVFFSDLILRPTFITHLFMQSTRSSSSAKTLSICNEPMDQ